MTSEKRRQLDRILTEYGRVVNFYVGLFWFNPPKSNNELDKSLLDKVESWFSARLKKTAAREALSMVQAVRNRKRQKGDKSTPKKPKHRGNQMMLCDMNITFELSKSSTEFDAWLHFQSIGEKIIFDVPIRFHRQYLELASWGKRLNSYFITRKSVQFCFEIETGPKLPLDAGIGIDTGINALASLSTGEQLGTDIKQHIERIKRCKHGSKGQKRARLALRHRMDAVAKQVVQTPGVSFVVVENLKGITQNTKHPKRRLGKNMRRSIGAWNVRYWLERIQRNCERNRVSFRSVSPHHTSQICSKCGHTDRMNRRGEKFKCLACGYEDNADVQASRTILHRFITGKYGSGCKPHLLEL